MEIKNKFYRTFLILALLFSIVENIFSLILFNKLQAMIHIGLATIVLLLFFLKSNFLRVSIKGWAIVPIIGGTLVLLSQGLFKLGGAENRIELVTILVALIHIVVGYLFIRFCDSSVVHIK